MKKLVKILSVTMPTMTCFAIGNNTIIPSILQPSKKQNITKADLNDLYGANVNIGSFDQKPNGETVLSSVKIVESGFHNESPVWYGVVVNDAVDDTGTAIITPNDKCPYYTTDAWQVNWTLKNDKIDLRSIITSDLSSTIAIDLWSLSEKDAKNTILQLFKNQFNIPNLNQLIVSFDVTSQTFINSLYAPQLGSVSNIVMTVPTMFAPVPDSTFYTQDSVIRNFSLSIQILDVNYSGNVYNFNIPQNGTYLMETWGGMGGSRIINANISGGAGGYSSGMKQFNQDDSVGIYVGQKPDDGSLTGGWNGGGNAGADGNGSGYGGGGATDIKFGGTDYTNRIIVAGGGGGGGSSWVSGHQKMYGTPACGGGLAGVGGGTAGDTARIPNNNATQTAGTQNGIGENNSQSGWGAGGGGGYRGGKTGTHTSWTVETGGGGSGYINNLINAYTIAGNDYLHDWTITTAGGGAVVGNNDNGHARIYWIGE
ncbi:MAG: hypothetical protein LBJ97_04220 [Mycoplasmataceae bacterium]|nr:hypothetical protein [Mycoplasmataceae bacterium]